VCVGVSVGGGGGGGGEALIQQGKRGERVARVASGIGWVYENPSYCLTNRLFDGNKNEVAGSAQGNL